MIAFFRSLGESHAMAVMTQFANLEMLRSEVPSCPLVRAPHQEDFSECKSCSFNIAYPGQAEPGCSYGVSLAMLQDASGLLAERDAELAAEFQSLLKDAQHLTGAKSEINAQRWMVLAEKWFVAIGAPESSATKAGLETEVAMVAARFSRAAATLGRAVDMFY